MARVAALMIDGRPATEITTENDDASDVTSPRTEEFEAQDSTNPIDHCRGATADEDADGLPRRLYVDGGKMR